MTLRRPAGRLRLVCSLLVFVYQPHGRCSPTGEGSRSKRQHDRGEVTRVQAKAPRRATSADAAGPQGGGTRLRPCRAEASPASSKVRGHPPRAPRVASCCSPCASWPSRSCSGSPDAAGAGQDRLRRGRDVATSELDGVHDERRDLVQWDALLPARRQAGTRCCTPRSKRHRTRRRAASWPGRTRGGHRTTAGSISQLRPSTSTSRLPAHRSPCSRAGGSGGPESWGMA